MRGHRFDAVEFTMRQKIKRGIIIVAGALFLILGVIGLALPFLQGFLFIAIGLVLLSLCFPSITEWVEKRTAPYPKLQNMVRQVREWVAGKVGEV